MTSYDCTQIKRVNSFLHCFWVGQNHLPGVKLWNGDALYIHGSKVINCEDHCVKMAPKKKLCD